MSGSASASPSPTSKFAGRRGRRIPRTFDYQLDGVAAEGLVGLEYSFGPHVSAFGEYKLSFSTNDADLVGGGSLETDVWTNHVTLGLSYRFGGPPVAEPYAPY